MLVVLSSVNKITFIEGLKRVGKTCTESVSPLQDNANIRIGKKNTGRHTLSTTANPMSYPIFLLIPMTGIIILDLPDVMSFPI